VQTNLLVAWRTFPALYKRQAIQLPDACNWQCVSWPLFDVDLAYCLECKVDETRMAGMSNVWAFPAVVFDGNGTAVL
jgi:hypothetical protein